MMTDIYHTSFPAGSIPHNPKHIYKACRLTLWTSHLRACFGCLPRTQHTTHHIL